MDKTYVCKRHAKKDILKIVLPHHVMNTEASAYIGLKGTSMASMTPIQAFHRQHGVSHCISIPNAATV